MRFVCIDFETANNNHASICSVGVAIMEDNNLIEAKEWLVKPHHECDYFDPFNSMIHGITADDVKNSPEFIEIYKQIQTYFQNTIIVAHCAAFDMSCLRKVLDLYNIPYPAIQYLCTYKVALKTWDGLYNYKLDTVCNSLNIDFIHHNAREDAIACGKVLFAACLEKQVTNIHDFVKLIGMRLGRLYLDGYEPCSIANRSNRNNYKSRIDCKTIFPQTDVFDVEHEFYNKEVVFTGTLLSMHRIDAMQKVVNVGGYIRNYVTNDTDFLVMGIQDYSKFTDGKESSKTRKAKKLIAAGKKLQIIDEGEFLKLLNSF